MKVLHIDAGITPNSVSRQISAAVMEAVRRSFPDAEIADRDLDADPIPHLDGRGLATLADNEALQAFLDADLIVLGAPMYNFGIPSQLKAWFDRIMVAGKTFRYTPDGPRGLAAGKHVIVASARGGVFAEGAPAQDLDLQERYLATAFRFIGVENCVFVRAEGVAIGPDQRQAAIAEALKAIPKVVGELAPALAA